MFRSLALFFVFLSPLSLALKAAILTVNSSADAGPGSLRQTILDSSSGDTIIFDPTIFTGGPANIITLGGTQLTVDRDLTIDASSIPDGITVDANGAATGHRVIEILAGSTVSILHLSLINGNSQGALPQGIGGGISNQGNLTLTRVIISNNSAGDNGGGIYNEGTLTLDNTTLSGNSSGNRGGGIVNLSTSSLTLNNSTLSGNTADSGGALFNFTGLVTFNNSTISGNSSDDFSGGIFNNSVGTLVLNCSTIANNNATNLGGGLVSYGQYTLNNTLIANNNAALGPDHFSTNATPTLQGVNLLSNLDESNLAPGVNVLVAVNPLLSPLNNYGGSTQTMPPLPGSPAINPPGGYTIIDPPLLATDQHGVSRLLHSTVDIGAVESFCLAQPPFSDTDNDGINDLYEGPSGPYPHLIVGNDDSDLDSDGDGDSDASEIGNLTDLFDPSDKLQIISFTRAAGFDPLTNPVFDITWSCFPGKSYSIETNTALIFDGSTILGPVTPNGFTHSETITLQPGRDFVRVNRN